jgi:hypothetical protein
MIDEPLRACPLEARWEAPSDLDGVVGGVAINQDDFVDLARHALEDVGQVVFLVEGGDHNADTHSGKDRVRDDTELLPAVAGHGNLDVFDRKPAVKLFGLGSRGIGTGLVQLNDVFGLGHVPLLPQWSCRQLRCKGQQTEHVISRKPKISN